MASIEQRRTEDGKLTYRVKVRLKGHPTQSATFDRLTDARKWASSTESAIREGRYFKTAEARRHTLGDAIARYRRDVLPGEKLKEQAKKRAILARWEQELGHALLADITPAALADVRDRLSSEVTRRGSPRAPATVVSYLNALGAVLTRCVNDWEWLDDSPMRKTKKPTPPRGRVRFLSDDERARLLDACRASSSQHLYTVVVLALSTGARLGEITGLRWPDIDLSRGRATLHQTKNGDVRAVHLSGHALELLRAAPRRLDTDLLFPGKAKPGRRPAKPAVLKKSWEAAIKRAGIEDFKFHDLRHSAASYLAMNGATLAEIAEVLGHRTLAMVKRYAHLSDAHVAGVVERMNQKIFG